jgi:hypothetical protein
VQRKYIKKEEAASPTVMTESTMLGFAIAAHERRFVRTGDVPGAFVNTMTDEYVIMALRGEMAELLVKLEPKIYRKYVTRDAKGKPILYVRLLKALYGLLRSALLFYRKLRGELEAYGFEVNPYDPCVANMMTPSGKQMTVMWHVDDLLATCEDDFELTKLFTYLGGIYGPKLTMKKGNKQEYLGVDYELPGNGKVEASMFKFIDDLIEEFPEPITSKAATPAADHLFKIRPEQEAKYLPEEQAALFHHFTAKLLFLSGRARRDIQTAVAFLTTRVKKPDEDDWGKLKRVIKYLWGTRRLKLTLAINDLTFTKWWIDAAHNVHWDCKGHTGAMMSLGEGAAASYSRRHKSNVRSSTEGEIAAVDQMMPEVLHSLRFLRAQGYNVNHAKVYQDNKSAQLLEINGRFSSTKRTKHIDAKFFFVKDQIDKGDICIEDCPTEVMWADCNSKPLQGKGFRVQRSMLMNCPENYVDAFDPLKTQAAAA